MVVLDDLSRGHPEFIPGVRLVIGSRMKALSPISFLKQSLTLSCISRPKVSLANPCETPTSIPEERRRRHFPYVRHGQSRSEEDCIFVICRSVWRSESVPIPETAPLRPMSPYGESKVFFERALGWYDKAYGLQSVSLRYFNAAGADPSGRLGEDHDPETHLIPLVIRAALTGEPLTVFGNDYSTPDGTCIRDYIHVSDLAEAHVLALKALSEGLETTVVNIGTGRGFR